MTTCPVCGAAQADGLLCNTDTTRLERALGDVPSIVADLDVTISRQARIGSSGKGGPAHERTPVHLGAVAVKDDLANTLSTWARDVRGRGGVPTSVILSPERPTAVLAAWTLLTYSDAIRRHPAVAQLVDEILDAINQARRVVDRPADRVYLGQCMAEFEGVTCYEEIYARAGASEVACKVCGITHEVGERRATLLQRAEDFILTVREASQVMGEVGGIIVTEQRIRRYIERKRIPLHRIPSNRGKAEESDALRLGDLMAVVVDDDERKRSA